MIEKRIAAVLVGGAAFLLIEVRFEHREVLGETWVAWIPLVCAALLLAGGGIALVFWHCGGRRVLAALFALSFVTGAVGLWFHSGGHPFRQTANALSAWTLKPGDTGKEPVGSEPPPFAPAAFSGLGLVGLIACLTPPRGDQR
jgi:hypothetical protein